jgi:formylglycine-generating enzyme
MKSATSLLLAFVLGLPAFARAQSTPGVQNPDWPKKVKLLQETRLDILLGTVKASRKVPPNTEVDVLQVDLPNLVIRQNNATATIPADTTDFFEKAGTALSGNNSRETEQNLPSNPQNLEEIYPNLTTNPGPETLNSDEEREFFKACENADTEKIKAMLSANPKLAHAAMLGRSGIVADGATGSFPFIVNALHRLIKKTSQHPKRIEAIKALVEGGVDPTASTSEEGASWSYGLATSPSMLTIEELDYLLGQGADPDFGWCSAALPPLGKLASQFVKTKSQEKKKELAELMRIYIKHGANPDKWSSVKGAKIKSAALISEMTGDPELAAILAEKKKTPHISNIEQTAGTQLTKPEMILVKGGTLPQDSELAGQSAESFEIGKYEVTWHEWREVSAWAAKNGYSDLLGTGKGSSPNHPVRQITWLDALKWCNAKSEKNGLQPYYSVNGLVFRTGKAPYEGVGAVEMDSNANGYRLPTETEWEWAARGGLSSKGYTYSGSNDISDVAWNNVYKRMDKPVGTKKPNELGIFDMSGGVWEWCWNAAPDEMWDPSVSHRRIRGGATQNFPIYCKINYRKIGYDLDSGSNHIGFRLARNAKP